MGHREMPSYAVLMSVYQAFFFFLCIFFSSNSVVDSEDDMQERPSFNLMSEQTRGMKRKREMGGGQGGHSVSTATSASGDGSSDGSEDDINPSKYIKSSTQAQIQPSPVVGKMMVSRVQRY